MTEFFIGCLVGWFCRTILLALHDIRDAKEQAK